MPAVIRAWVASDTLEVVQLMQQCYCALAPTEQYTADELQGLCEQCCNPEEIRKRYAQSDAFVIAREGRVLGVVALEQNEIVDLFVRPDAQGQGLGRTLVAEAEKRIAAAGHSLIKVRSATAPGFYERLGYTIVKHDTCRCGPLKGRPVKLLEKRFSCS